MTNRETAVVTGGNRGIGAGVVDELAAAGYDVVFSHRGEPAKARDVAESARRYGGRVEPVEADFRDPDQVRHFAEWAIGDFGPVQVLVNNAGRGYSERLYDTRLTDVDDVYAINFRAPLLLTQLVSRHMIDERIAGRIVFVTSIRARWVDPVDAVYGGLKAALDRAMRSWALELSVHRIRVNAIAPGAIEVFPERAHRYRELDRDIPLGRTGTPSDIAKTVRFLVSDDASYITGASIPVDGGMPLPATYGGDDIGPGNRWGQVQVRQPTSDFARHPGGYDPAPSRRT
ncbi:SDR family oxidoreductase [Dactylosporangium salmoneum]|uniref:3-oxoacyl-[acyl-carrier-protein] reductase n=1 Tax=Dactylosporangium salmoneum TaxID=53361 RepID=A0ABN3HX17_9ACTN